MILRHACSLCVQVETVRTVGRVCSVQRWMTTIRILNRGHEARPLAVSMLELGSELSPLCEQLRGCARMFRLFATVPRRTCSHVIMSRLEAIRIVRNSLVLVAHIVVLLLHSCL